MSTQGIKNDLMLMGLLLLLYHSCYGDVAFNNQQSLIGPDFIIKAEQGQQLGNNLFHSFSEFSLLQGQSATFTGSNQLENIISRVYGDNPSLINGVINSLPPSADFWFMNPRGIILGENASLNVGGAIHLSTADYIRFKDKQILFANPDSNTQLSLASPQSFGFIKSDTAIQFNQSQLNLSSDINLSAAQIKGSGNIDTIDKGVSLVAIQQGEVDLSKPRPQVSKGAILGQINLGNNSNLNLDENNYYINGGSNIHLIADKIDLNQVKISSYNYTPEAGSLSLQGREIKIINSQIVSLGEHEGQGNNIEIKASESLLLKGINASSDSQLSNPDNQIIFSTIPFTTQATEIFSGHQNQGSAGNIIIQAPDVEVDNAYIVNQPFFKESGQKPLTGGNSGAIIIDVERLAIRNGGVISTFNLDSVQGGLIKITAADWVLLEDKTGSQSSHITAGTSSKGSAGHIILDSKQLYLHGGAIYAQSNAGFNDIFALEANIEEEGKASSEQNTVFSNPDDIDSGNAGDITINTEQLEITSGGQIATRTFTSGDAGSLTINAKQSLTIRGNNFFETGIFAGTEGSGNAGKLSINTHNLALYSGEIRSDSGRQSFTSPDTLGDAGSIAINAKNLNIESGGGITSTSYGNGDGGQININISDKLLISGLSNLSNNPEQAETEQFFQETGIDATNYGNNNQPSNIFIQAGTVVLQNGASIYSQSLNQSAAGSINLIAAKDVIIKSGSLINTEANTIGGTIAIQAGDIIHIKDSNIIATSHGDNRHHNSGNLSLNSGQIVVLDNATLEARAFAGNGGNIRIHTDHFIKNDRTQLDASSDLGIQGEVELETITTDINGLTTSPKLTLPKQPVLLENRCRKRKDPNNQYSSLIVEAARPKAMIKNGQLVFVPSESKPCPN